MPLWNTRDKKPADLTEEEKRHVVADTSGWTSKKSYTGVGGIVRNKSETLVAIGDLVKLNEPVITQIYVANNAGGAILKTVEDTTVNVVFSEEVTIGAGATQMTLELENKSGGNNAIATATTDPEDIVNANNTVVFTVNVVDAGDYEIGDITATNAKLHSVDGGSSEAANVTISDSVKDSVGTLTFI